MTKVTHSFQGKTFTQEGDENILLTNLKGSFIYFPLNNNNSKFNGVFYYDKETQDMIKVINSFKKQHNEINVSNITATRDNEKIYFFNNSIIYQENGEITLNLDIRYIYDFSTWDRIYQFIEIDNNTLQIKYTKNDFEFNIFLHSNNLSFQKIANWTKEEYQKDIKRNSPPYELYTFDALKLNLTDDLILAFDKDEKQALENLKTTLENKDDLIKAKQNYLKSITNNIKNPKISQALNLATRSLDKLTIDNENISGIFAGLPWFFQFWTRDEAICTGALIKKEKYSLAKKILLKEINEIREDGRNPNRMPHSDLGSADGIGLSFFRLFKLITTLDKQKETQKYFSKEELSNIYEKLQDSINKLKSNYLKNNLIYNGPKETWMDTDETITGEKDTREGFCIEIQALFLTMLEFKEYLEKILQKTTTKESSNFKKEIRKRFLLKDKIADRITPNNNPDETIRPNIFLAYNYNKKLFTKKTWELVFTNILPKLWLNWGGVSTIDKTSKWFCENYTGQNNLSYHRGDSWFFVNNFTAIALYEINKKKFQKEINKIIESSTNDLLYNGCIGHASEVSDAKEQTSKASPVQGWSTSTYIELILTARLDL